jgi:hypothetical protein
MAPKQNCEGTDRPEMIFLERDVLSDFLNDTRNVDLKGVSEPYMSPKVDGNCVQGMISIVDCRLLLALTRRTYGRIKTTRHIYS